MTDFSILGLVIGLAGLLALRAVLLLLDTLENLALAALGRRTTDDLIVSELADHAFEYVHRLGLEVVLVVVNPAKQGGYQRRQVRRHSVEGKSDYGDLDEA